MDLRLYIGKYQGKIRKQAKIRYFDDFRPLDIVFCKLFVTLDPRSCLWATFKRILGQQNFHPFQGTLYRRQKWPFLTIFKHKPQFQAPWTHWITFCLKNGTLALTVASYKHSIRIFITSMYLYFKKMWSFWRQNRPSLGGLIANISYLRPILASRPHMWPIFLKFVIWIPP